MGISKKELKLLSGQNGNERGLRMAKRKLVCIKISIWQRRPHTQQQGLRQSRKSREMSERQSSIERKTAVDTTERRGKFDRQIHVQDQKDKQRLSCNKSMHIKEFNKNQLEIEVRSCSSIS